ncbi:MAG TPA: hypothetical protein VIY72_06150 [Acidimicrobiales bacterium]
MIAATEDVSPTSTAGGFRRPRWPSLSFVVGAAVVMTGAYIGAAAIADNSFFTHLATGRYILDHGFPHHDIYSFTAPGERWVVQSWLASVLYGAIDHTVGLVGIRALTAVLCGVVAGIGWTLTRPANGLIARLAIAGAALGLGAVMWSPRPLMIGLVLLGVTVLVAEGRIPAPVLLPVFWLWVNSHGSFPLGLVALGCYALGARLDGDRRPHELRALAWAAGGTVLGAINPLGPVLLTFPVTLLQRQDVLTAIVEWQSPSFTAGYGRVFLLLVVMAIAALVRRPSWRSAVPFVVFLVAALTATRNLPVAALVIIPGIARGADGLGSLGGELRSRATAVLAAVVILVGGLATVDRLSEPDLDLRDFPVDAVAFMDQSGLLGPETRRVTSDVVGNYLELLLGSDAAVSIDDRVDMYPTEVVEDELVLIRGSARWREVLEQWDGDVVLWERGAPLSQLLAEDDAWRLVYSDESWVVYQRRQT